MLAEGIGHIDAPGEQALKPLGFYEIGGKVADIDLREIDVDVVPVAFARGMGRYGEER
jgi:hypothetical protein